ncbi:reverse transcriptase domain-containing protein [Tanacetum coccineum]
MKLLDTSIIYPIADSPWVSHIHCVPKKGGITVVTNENDELVPTRTVTGWRVCIDYRKLNEATAKDHSPLPFMDQMRMPFGLCNAPATFQRCMLVIFLDMINESVKVFMDDLSVFGNSFEKCLKNLDKMLQRCKDAHLVFNWGKCHFMVKEGIMPGHKMSSARLEVDKAKINIDNNEISDDSEVDDNFLGETLMEINTRDEVWKLDDALWDFRTAYKTPTGTTPYKLIYGKNCHLPFEIEHRAYWALKNCNQISLLLVKNECFNYMN